MKQYAGLVIGVIYIFIAFGAFRTGAHGWENGYPDLGLWWTVIGVILTVAGFAALVGTWIHTQARVEEH